MAIEAQTEIPKHLTDSTVLATIVQRVRQAHALEIEAIDQLTAPAARARAEGDAARVRALEELANDLEDATPILEALDTAERLAVTYRRRER